LGLNKNIVIVSNPGEKLSRDNQAWTLCTDITLNSNGGYNTDYDKVGNFKAILKHEIFHVDDNIYQKNHPNILPKIT
jgi:hypothetical protein